MRRTEMTGSFDLSFFFFFAVGVQLTALVKMELFGNRLTYPGRYHLSSK